jgi:phosphate-selective porin OprO and OprP
VTSPRRRSDFAHLPHSAIHSGCQAFAYDSSSDTVPFAADCTRRHFVRFFIRPSLSQSRKNKRQDSHFGCLGGFRKRTSGIPQANLAEWRKWSAVGNGADGGISGVCDYKEVASMLRGWLKGVRKYYVCACLILAAVTGTSKAGDDTADLRKLVEEQSKQIQALKERLDNTATTPVNAENQAQLDEGSVRKIVNDYMKEQDVKKNEAKAQKEAEGYGVAEDLSISTRWNPLIGRGLEFSTPAKDFIIHIGGRYYEDFVAFDQSQLSNVKNYTTNTPSGIGAGVATGNKFAAPVAFGTGSYQDGTLFRRLRLTVDGQLYENWEFFTEYEFEQTSGNNIVNLDEFWLGIKNVPIVQNVRVGNVKLQQGMESINSSRSLTFLERSALFDTFDTEFGMGLWMFQDFFDQHMTLHEQLLRKGANDDGIGFGNGLWHYVARATFLPLWEDQGRTMLHLGASYQFANRTFKQNGNPLYPQNNFQDQQVAYATRVAQRDTIGTYSATTNGNAGGTSNGTDGNATNVINTGTLNAQGFNQIGAEMFFVRGPFWAQAEYIVSAVDGYKVPVVAAGSAPGAITANTRFVDSKDPVFWGYYIQCGYFLTGENRYYDRRTGRVPGTYASRILTPAYFVKDEDGHYDIGRGAWEIAARFAHVQLDSENVLGGNLNETTFGLNWYPIQNMKIQFQYDLAQRTGLFPVNAPGFSTGAAATQPVVGDRGFPSWVSGFGVRFGLDY